MAGECRSGFEEGENLFCLLPTNGLRPLEINSKPESEVDKSLVSDWRNDKPIETTPVDLNGSVYYMCWWGHRSTSLLCLERQGVVSIDDNPL